MNLLSLFASSRAFGGSAGAVSLLEADAARTERVQAARALAVGSPIADAPLSFPTGNDFRGGFFTFRRRLAPSEVRFILEGAAAGNFNLQWDLFALMEDSWPRLAKNLAELRRAAARATYVPQPYAERGAPPTDSAKEKAALVAQAMRNWSPRIGTLELGFEDTLFHALDAYGKGISALEVQWQQAQGAILPRCSHVLSPRRYGWNAEGTELGLISSPGSLPLSALTPQSTATDMVWQPFVQDKFLVGIWHARTGAPGATAVLRALAPYWVGITFGWEWLLSTAQIFGVPFRWANFDRNKPELGAQLRDMLAAMGTSGFGAFPDGTKLEFKEAVSNARDNPQVVLQELADKACDLLILGQELSGGAHAAGLGSGSAGLQEGVRADRLQAASQWCADLLNYQLVPAILRANYGEASETPTVVPDVDEEPDPLKLAQRDQILLAAGIELPRTWLYERHGIPEPIDGEETIGGSADAGAPDGDSEADPNAGPESAQNEKAGSPVAAKATFSRQSGLQAQCKHLHAKSGSLAPANQALRKAGLHEIVAAKKQAFAELRARFTAIAGMAGEAQLAALVAVQAELPKFARKHAITPGEARAWAESLGTELVAGAVANAQERHSSK